MVLYIWAYIYYYYDDVYGILCCDIAVCIMIYGWMDGYMQEKDVVMKEYLSLKETNEQLKAAQQAHHHHHLRLSSLF
jgi:translation initiation factor RLI1